jgi:hypothetical protein
MDTAQVMEMMKAMLAEMETNRRADRKTDKEEMNASNKRMLAEIKADRKAHREEVKGIMATIRAWGQTDTKDNEEEAMTCEEKTEVRLEEVEEPASEEMKPEVVDKEVPVMDAEVAPVGEPGKKRRDRRRLATECRQKKEKDQNLDARRRRKEQGRAQRKHGCPKNLVAAHRGTTCRAVMTRRRILLMETTRSR